MPAERAESAPRAPPSDTIESVLLVGLELVAVDDDRQAGQPLLGGGLHPLVVLALLELAVADQHDDAAAAPEAAFGPGDPRPLEIPVPSKPELASIPGTPISG